MLNGGPTVMSGNSLLYSYKLRRPLCPAEHSVVNGACGVHKTCSIVGVRRSGGSAHSQLVGLENRGEPQDIRQHDACSSSGECDCPGNDAGRLRKGVRLGLNKHKKRVEANVKAENRAEEKKEDVQEEPEPRVVFSSTYTACPLPTQTHRPTHTNTDTDRHTHTYKHKHTRMHARTDTQTERQDSTTTRGHTRTHTLAHTETAQQSRSVHACALARTNVLTQARTQWWNSWTHYMPSARKHA
eukprot:2719480-Amphidinium_carterae.2